MADSGKDRRGRSGTDLDQVVGDDNNRLFAGLVLVVVVKRFQLAMGKKSIRVAVGSTVGGGSWWRRSPRWQQRHRRPSRNRKAE